MNFQPNEQTIVIFKGQSQYNVLRIASDTYAKIFGEMGYNVRVIDLLDSDWKSHLEYVLNRGVFFVFSPNGMGVDISIDNVSLWDKTGITFVASYGDHPIYHYDRINSSIKNMLVLPGDESYIDFFNKYYLSIFSRAYIKPGVYKDSSVYTEEDIEKRDIDILFAGSYQDPEEIFLEIKGLNPFIKNILEDMIDALLYQNKEPMHIVMEKVLKEHNIELGFFHIKKMSAYMALVDRYVRRRRRKEVIESLREHPIHIYGGKWEHLSKYKHNFIFKKPVPYTELKKLMGKTKILLNVNPSMYHYAVSERIFNGMAYGATLLTDANKFTDDNFIDGQNILLYEPRDIKGKNIISEKITFYLDDLQRLDTIRRKGQKLALNEYTSTEKAENIIKNVIFHKLMME